MRESAGNPLNHNIGFLFRRCAWNMMIVIQDQTNVMVFFTILHTMLIICWQAIRWLSSRLRSNQVSDSSSRGLFLLFLVLVPICILGSMFFSVLTKVTVPFASFQDKSVSLGLSFVASQNSSWKRFNSLLLTSLFLCRISARLPDHKLSMIRVFGVVLFYSKV